ncbi:hypothetical protein MUY35_03575 [Aliiroseovarius sp. S1339]|uniref:hypothetical protein n=1 Tax=Aliiroseovarius sp. S1339 TaxID=2936990 RepID=UPI0020C05543|nr:hypothetical protein [Aliiroseovarius sp. S1339]MCK8462926.1 hypothetical protein [Aliiroseovarius sp. S1339]
MAELVVRSVRTSKGTQSDDALEVISIDPALDGSQCANEPVLEGTVEYVSADAISASANGVTCEVFVARHTS